MDDRGIGTLELILAIIAIAFLVAMFMRQTAHGAGLDADWEGDNLATSYCEAECMPVLMETTAYCEGDICSGGVKPREGICAVAPEWYGCGVVVYEAVWDEEAREFTPGGLLGIFEGLDTGYGRSTGDGRGSRVLPGERSRGTIEAGKCVDVYKPTYGKAKEWMKVTKGRVFVQIIKAEG